MDVRVARIDCFRDPRNFLLKRLCAEKGQTSCDPGAEKIDEIVVEPTSAFQCRTEDAVGEHADDGCN